MERQHTYKAGEQLPSGATTRAERRHQKKFMKRYLKKQHRAALHGLPRMDTPPSLLQSLRMTLEIQKRQAEVDALLERTGT